MFTGKTVVCMHCGITLYEKKFPRDTRWETPWGERHYWKFCNLRRKS